MTDFSHSGARDRGICSECGREFDVTVKGVMRAHRKERVDWYAPPPCPGSGKKPKENV